MRHYEATVLKYYLKLIVWLHDYVKRQRETEACICIWFSIGGVVENLVLLQLNSPVDLG